MMTNLLTTCRDFPTMDVLGWPTHFECIHLHIKRCGRVCLVVDILTARQENWSSCELVLDLAKLKCELLNGIAGAFKYSRSTLRTIPQIL